MNDGKCDARGRLWCGTMGYEKSPGEPVSSQGTLYCYHGGTPSPIFGRVSCLWQGEGCGLQWVWLRGVVYCGHFDWLLGGIVAAAEMRMRSVWVEVERCTALRSNLL